MEPKKTDTLKLINPSDVTICEATAQMLRKAQRDGVETAFDRAANMKACPIGADSACCKHCAMGPCRLNSKDPYGKVGVCGADIDTIQARNFARMVASGSAAHTDHGMGILDLFRGVVNGTITDYKIKDTIKLENVAKSIGIETEGKSTRKLPKNSIQNSKKPTPSLKGKFHLQNASPSRPWKTGGNTISFPGAPCGKSWK
jgi:carbon-monoxide dehydrogenase catalytic subunit